MKMHDSKYLVSVLETVLDAIITIDDCGIIQTANAATERMFGYLAEEIVGQNVSMLMPEPYRSAHDGYLSNYLHSGEKKIIGIGREVQGKRKNGSVFPMSLAVTEMRFEEADHLHIEFVGIIRDLTVQHRQLNDLKLLHAGLEAADDAVVLTDAQGVIVWINSSFTRLTGYTEADALGNNVRILKSGVTPDAVYRKLWETIANGQEWRGEMVNRRKDGSLYPEDQSITPVRSEGTITHYVAIKRNATARKLAEQNAASVAMAAYEHLHGEILGTMSRSRDRRNLLQETLTILGNSGKYPTSALYLFDDWHGTLQCQASYCAPDDLAQEINPGEGLVGQAFNERRMLTIESADQMPLRIETGLLVINPVAVLACPISYQERCLGVLVLAAANQVSASDREFNQRIATELGAALQNLRQYEELKAMAEQLKLRTQEITHKNAELEHTNQLKREFLANMSHELRTPLNAVIGFSEVLRDELLGPLNPKQHDYVGEILDSASHLLSLINDILDLSKIEEGRMELALEPVNVEEALRNCMSIVKEKANARSIKLNLEFAGEIGIVRADGRKLRQIVYNLLSNAVKFTPENGQVQLAARLDEHKLRIDVSDTGIGIAEKDQARLFRPFEQLDGGLARKQEGTGLGLAMVKRLAELHGGTVSVNSQLGVGSCFSVCLPVHPVTDAGEKPAGEADSAVVVSAVAQALPPATCILLIEAQDGVADIITAELTAAGHHVLRATTGRQGLSLAAELLPSLVILNIRLPDIDGWEVLKLMRHQPELRAIPVISVAAEADKGVHLGAIDVLEKPLRREWLLEAVVRALPKNDLHTKPYILVVDDDQRALDFIGTRLTQAGFRVTTVNGGRAAIESAKSSPPDLMIVDLMMPEISGFEVIAALRQEPATASIPIIVLTAMQLGDQERRNLERSQVIWMEKSSFNLADFMRLVEQSMVQPLRKTRLAHDTGGYQAKLLVVEDNLQHAELLRIYLEDAGYQVRIANNGRLALEDLASSEPDLIVLDLLMPEMDGYAFLDAKAARPQWQHIPVIVVSAIANPQANSPVLAADAVLRKPIGRAELLETVSRFAPNRQQHHKPRLLIIDDDPKAVKIITSFLSGGEFELVTAFSGSEGLALAKSEKPDIVLLDLIMPDLTGFEVLASLKEDSATNRIPVLIISARRLSAQEHIELQDKVTAIAEKGRLSNHYLHDLIKRALYGDRP